ARDPARGAEFADRSPARRRCRQASEWRGERRDILRHGGRRRRHARRADPRAAGPRLPRPPGGVAFLSFRVPSCSRLPSSRRTPGPIRCGDCFEKRWLTASCTNTTLWLWVPAFAGTTWLKSPQTRLLVPAALTRPSRSEIIVPLSSEGAGNAGRASAPIVSREKKTHEGRATGSPDMHRHSLRDGFTVSFVLSPEIGLVVSVG